MLVLLGRLLDTLVKVDFPQAELETENDRPPNIFQTGTSLERLFIPVFWGLCFSISAGSKFPAVKVMQATLSSSPASLGCVFGFCVKVDLRWFLFRPGHNWSLKMIAPKHYAFRVGGPLICIG